ncbi:hypothetical protein AGDE_15220 [Angomonas deanei]|uniref:Uncharacterized protein n=1 Tax=Angomonas deanei TaxID=59799 RepID=A0A7G2CVK8_9TRYP|nr:hypothetical protein AGDE_15220 [Angomonas deanei]CAD2222453.1 hypothetical protein, conserved [Angomonas deanei]|eukprot:EPY19471.1 hypothetical protein AGDE_15220 [Angomonas deanei]
MKERRQNSANTKLGSKNNNNTNNNNNIISVEEEEKILLEKITYGILHCQENMRYTLTHAGSENNNNENSNLHVHASLWRITDKEGKTILHILASHKNEIQQKNVMTIIIRPLLRYLEQVQYTISQQNEEMNNNKENNKMKTELNNLLNHFIFFDVMVHTAADHKGRTALQEACRSGFLPLIGEYLLSFENHENNQHEILKRVFYVDLNGQTVFHDLVAGWTTEFSDQYKKILYFILSSVQKLLKYNETFSLEGFPLPENNNSVFLQTMKKECTITRQLQLQHKNHKNHQNHKSLGELINLADKNGNTPFLLSTQFLSIRGVQNVITNYARN